MVKSVTTSNQNLAAEAAPVNGAGAAVPVSEARLRGAGLSRFRLIRPASKASAPGAAAAQAVAGAIIHRQQAPDAARIQLWLRQFGQSSRHLLEADVIDYSADGQPGTPLAGWPQQRQPASAVLALARRVIDIKRYVVDPPAGVSAERMVAVPLVAAGLPRTAIVARFRRDGGNHATTELKEVLQASVWLRLLLAAGAALTPQARAPAPAVGRSGAAWPQAEAALEVFAAALEQRDFPAAALAVVNHLAEALGADRVSLGMLQRQAVQLLALSGNSSFNPATALAEALRGAMAEALRQGVALSCPEAPDAEPRELAAQQALLRAAHGGAVCTIPFAAGGVHVGAVVVEWRAVPAAGTEYRGRCQALLALAGPLLAALQAAETGWLERARAGASLLLRRLLGPQRPWLKSGLLAGAVLLLLAAVLPGTHRVSGDAVLRGSVQRVVLAPVDGFIATATARPGDVVAADAVLAQLDDQALRLEVARWQAEYERLNNEYREALSLLDSAKVAVLRAEMDRAAADFELAQDNLSRSEIRAPIAGIVVSGDFSQSLGAPVQRGATLFELAPLDGYRVSARISEREVAQLAPGQRGRLVLTAMPGADLYVAVERVTPVSEVVDGSNVFEVEARLVGAPANLRPGMQGVVKFSVGRARLLWLWTHDALDWLRVKLWSIGLWS